MSTDSDENQSRELDVRAIDGEPFSDIMDAMESLPEGETLVLINSFEPEPLYSVLEQRGFTYESRQIESDVWQIQIRHA